MSDQAATETPESQLVPQRKRKVRAIAIPVQVKKALTDTVDAAVDATDSGAPGSTQDPFEPLRTRGVLIDPPFDLDVLSSLHENNSMLGQIVEAMETNVVGFGWSLEPVRVQDGAETADGKEDPKVEAEWERFQLFLEHGNWGEDATSLIEVRRQQRKDLELTGMSYLEIVQNGLGDPVGYVHAPSFRMRITISDKEATGFDEIVMIGRGKRRRPGTVRKYKRFRRYVQVDPFSNKLTYFKDLDDPRPISRETGEPLTDPADFRNTSKLANPMIFRRLYAPRTPYGVPRYIGCLLAILGGRCAEEVNYATFRNNQIPSMLLLVSGGALTDETIQRITTFSQEVIQGDDNRSKFLVIEAEPDPAVDNTNPGSTGGSANVRIEAKPLREARNEDAMFIEYEKGNAEKLRMSWRLPPITIGGVTEYSRAVADTARRLAEEQIFEPERRAEDWHWSRLLRRMGMILHEFQTNSPNVTNDEDLIQVMATAERSGAMTPRIATRLLSEMLGLTVPKADEKEVPPDVPFSLTMAKEVKNLAKPNEVGQQVTALKSMEMDDPVETLFTVVKSRYGITRSDFQDKTIRELRAMVAGVSA